MIAMANHEIFKALADPLRLRIVILLLNGELCVCDLIEILGLPQSTISRHMSRLKTAGLVTDRRNGKWVHYSLADNPLLSDLRNYLKRLRDTPDYRSDCEALGEYQKDKIC